MKVTTLMLALVVQKFLEKNHCTVSVVNEDNEFKIHYTLKMDVKPQPPITIKEQSIIIPTGSQEAVRDAILEMVMTVRSMP